MIKPTGENYEEAKGSCNDFVFGRNAGVRSSSHSVCGPSRRPSGNQELRSPAAASTATENRLGRTLMGFSQSIGRRRKTTLSSSAKQNVALRWNWDFSQF